MSEPAPIPFLPLLSAVVQEIAPGLMAELISWKCCRRCGGICNWATSDFSTVTGSMVCPHCRAFVVEWPNGVPMVCACGLEVEGEYLVLDGLPVSQCCGLSLSPPADYDPLRIAHGGPGVEGAEPHQHREVPVRESGDRYYFGEEPSNN